MNIDDIQMSKIINNSIREIIIKKQDNILKDILNELSRKDFIKEFCFSRIDNIEFIYENREWKQFGTIVITFSNKYYLEISTNSSIVFNNVYYNSWIDNDLLLEFIKKREIKTITKIFDDIYEKGQKYIQLEENPLDENSF